jgi:hypothetical protein
MHDKLIGPFFFAGKVVTGRSYLDMLELYALPIDHLKLCSKKMGRHHISATMLGITWTESWLRERSAGVVKLLGLLGRQI